MSGQTYAHWCRDGHVEIGHNDSSSEMCPLCRVIAALHDAAEALDAYSDVNDGADGRPTPNRAMSALQDIGEALAKAEGRS